MRRSLLALLAVAAFPAGAAAAPVLILDHHGRTVRRDDRFLIGPALTPAPVPGLAPRSVAAVAPRRHTRPRTVRRELLRLYRSHAVAQKDYTRYLASFNAALAQEAHLTGTRATELAGVTGTLHRIAASGQLSASRLPALFATLDANRRWWSDGPLLAYGERVEFTGSELVWEYYPGQGIQLTELGNFSKADGLYTGGPADYPKMEQLLAELIPLAARRGGGLTWEYYFEFDGGSPPWTSAMSQATALEALTRAYQATGNHYYLDVARRALPVFAHGPPVGVSVRTPRGSRFLQYTFAPDASIINAFLQTLIGLHDYARVSASVTAARLFAAGDAEARSEVPWFDTGAWSLYQPGVEDTLGYHELVTGFLQNLCIRTGAPVYCTTAQHFQFDLTTPPALQQLSFRARVHTAAALRFRLSKYSHVGVVVSRGPQTVLATSASFPYGVDQFTVPAIARPGSYSIRLAATDLAGNFSRLTGMLTVR